ncbi:MAG: hypothetical protein JWQ35_2009 [Bacteriovoracaceae bacterium]|nr:hypothetical protein [Bacteriovoracaceae bacterium]
MTSTSSEVDELKKRVRRLESAIEKHRLQTGHQMCWENDEELWSALNDGVQIDHTPPPWDEFMTRCAAYRKSKDDRSPGAGQ